MNFLYFQTIIQYRIPLDDNGRAGSPEVTKKFTTEIFGEHKKVKKESKRLVAQVGEQIEL